MIYVTDDHQDSAEYLARLLRRVGYTASVYSCGQDLLTQLQQQLPRLIILDVMMPQMNGIECLRLIRENPASHDVPVIMYSADFSFERHQEAKTAGAQEFLVKGTALWPDFLKVIQKYAAPTTTAPTPH